MKNMKLYTTKDKDEAKFKGWSVRAPKDFSKIIGNIQKDEEKNELFNKAFRELQRRSKKQKKKDEQQKEEIPTEVKNVCYGIGDAELQELQAVEL